MPDGKEKAAFKVVGILGDTETEHTRWETELQAQGVANQSNKDAEAMGIKSRYKVLPL